jgi:geranylgeranyl diphosphate synthase type I
MAYVMYRGLGGEEREEMLSLLVSLEIFHTFALMHDDIIDKGNTRHNHQTTHRHITDILKYKQRWSFDYEHDGNSQAILIGDILLSWALMRLHQFHTLPGYQRGHTIFSEMIDEVVVGQMLDVDMMTRDRVDMTLIEEKMKLKTAGYTFIRPMQIGVAFSQSSEEMMQFCFQFGQALGLAFQTQDDILDLTGDSSQLNKSILSDLKEHQHTFLTQYIFDYGSKEDIRDLSAWWGSEIRPTDQEQVIDVFERSGALDYANQMVETYLSRARQVAISNEQLSYQAQESLQSLISYIEGRSI